MRMWLICCVLLTATVNGDIHFEWNNFKATHLKQYNTLEEEKQRLDIFKENLKTIKEQNAKFHAGEDTHLLGITQFADLTDEEFIEKTSGRIGMEVDSMASDIPVFKSDGTATPDSFDWRNFTPRVVELPRNQGLKCRACWAFAAAEMIESFFSIKINHTYYPLSPQNLVNCVILGCTGGLPRFALNYVKNNGVALEMVCPYTGKDDDCQTYPGRNVYISSYFQVKTEDDMKEALVKNGPVGVSVDSKEWKLYVGGIYKAKQPFNRNIHDLVIDGYGTENGEDFWLLRNSWGPTWGENGYIRILRNTNEFGVGSEALSIDS